MFIIQLAHCRSNRVHASVNGWQRHLAWATEKRVIDDANEHCRFIEEQKKSYLLKVGDTGQVFRLPTKETK